MFAHIKKRADVALIKELPLESTPTTQILAVNDINLDMQWFLMMGLTFDLGEETISPRGEDC